MKHVIIAVLVLAFFLVLFLGRRYVYWSYQHLAYKAGINLNNIADASYVQWVKSQNGNFIYNQEATFLNNKINFQNNYASLPNNVLGDATLANSQRWIEVNMTEQKLYMKEGNTTVGSFLISSGKWAPTPLGTFHIWIKLRYTRMTGGSKALGTYYDLPNVPYTMYFYQGYGIHGAYWHNNFGQPMSHGCINMRPEEAGIVYNWASVGTKVVTHY